VFNLTQEPTGIFIWNLTADDLGPLGGSSLAVKNFLYNVSYMALDFGVTQELNNGIGCVNWTLTQVLDFRNRGMFT